jgi:hypothetical protein
LKAVYSANSFSRLQNVLRKRWSAPFSSMVSADGTRPCAMWEWREVRGADGGLASGYRAVKRDGVVAALPRRHRDVPG